MINYPSIEKGFETRRLKATGEDTVDERDTEKVLATKSQKYKGVESIVIKVI